MVRDLVEQRVRIVIGVGVVTGVGAPVAAIRVDRSGRRVVVGGRRWSGPSVLRPFGRSFGCDVGFERAGDFGQRGGAAFIGRFDGEGIFATSLVSRRDYAPTEMLDGHKLPVSKKEG